MKSLSVLIVLVLLIIPPRSHSQSITLESVDGLTGINTLETEQEITFNLRLTNGSSAMANLSNGFRIYSPDYAEWTTTVPDTYSFNWRSMFDLLFFIEDINVDGFNDDTVGFVGIRLFSPGFPAYFDDVAYKITIGPIPHFYEMQQICLDSSWFPTGGEWIWSTLSMENIYPSWDGPHCFYIGYFNPPVINFVHVEGELSPQNVTNHTPQFDWSYTDPTESKIQSWFFIEVGTDNDWAMAEMWDPGPIASSDSLLTYAGEELVDGETYYYRLSLDNSYGQSDWYEGSFRMNSVPTVPILLEPTDYAVVEVPEPYLQLENSIDAESDVLSYDFELYILFNTFISSMNGVPEGINQTSWSFDSELYDENYCYKWRARSYDGYEYSSWSEFEYFCYDTLPEPPGTPSIDWPKEGDTVFNYNLMPMLDWALDYLYDPDPMDVVHYKVTIATDNEFNFIAFEIDDLSDTFYTMTTPLELNEQYWWYVSANDLDGFENKSDTVTFITTCCIGMRGNFDGDELDAIDVGDLVFLVEYQFLGSEIPPPCEEEADIAPVTDPDGSVDIADIVVMVEYQFYDPPGSPPVDCR